MELAKIVLQQNAARHVFSRHKGRTSNCKREGTLVSFAFCITRLVAFCVCISKKVVLQIADKLKRAVCPLRFFRERAIIGRQVVFAFSMLACLFL